MYIQEGAHIDNQSETVLDRVHSIESHLNSMNVFIEFKWSVRAYL